MKFTLEITTDGAAFDDTEYPEFARNVELARILRSVANDVECGEIPGRCMDANGNSCGTFSLES